MECILYLDLMKDVVKRQIELGTNKLLMTADMKKTKQNLLEYEVTAKFMYNGDFEKLACIERSSRWNIMRPTLIE